jgi:GT2 family glycosyltransferase
VSTEVLVVIVTYNSAQVVGQLLDSLPAAQGQVTCEVVVVDNGSSDATLEVLDTYATVRVIEGTNVGYSAAINRAVRESAPTEAILVLNPDVVLSAGCVSALLDEQRRSGAGIVAPLVREEDGTVSPSLRREPTLLRNLGLGRTRHPLFAEYVDNPVEYERAHDTDWAVGAALLVSRDCHEQLGGWDESFFLYSEETDLCLRAWDRGLGVRYQPHAECMHIGGASGQSPHTHAMQATNRLRLFRRRHGVVSSTAYLVLSVASELSWWARGNPYALTAVRALVQPTKRPPQLNASDRLLPR